MVGETGFEPVLSSSRTTRAARLRYSPIVQKTAAPSSLAGPEQRWEGDPPGHSGLCHITPRHEGNRRHGDAMLGALPQLAW